MQSRKTSADLWHQKPYYSLDAWCKNTYGRKLYKAALDIGCTCPNRDGTLDTRGCIFCSAGGSGDFAGTAMVYSDILHRNIPDIPAQLSYAKSRVRAKINPDKFAGYIAYFQAFKA